MKKVLMLGCLMLSGVAFSQTITLISLQELNKIVDRPGENLKVINFWASWCGPCIKEMPYFAELSKNENVAVYLISLDFPEDLDKAEKILEKKQITASAYLLNEKNYDKYIRSIDSEWSGAIPATLFIRPNGERYFHEKAFDKEELNQLITNYNSK